MRKERHEVETIDGFDIEKRELTAEEASIDVTLDRIHAFHRQVGEDYLDTCSMDGQAEKMFLGFLMCKRPDLSPQILKIVNNGYMDLEFYEAFAKVEDESTEDEFYRLFAEFTNLTKGFKKRVNQVLIQIDEHYKN